MHLVVDVPPASTGFHKYSHTASAANLHRTVLPKTTAHVPITMQICEQLCKSVIGPVRRGKRVERVVCTKKKKMNWKWFALYCVGGEWAVLGLSAIQSSN